MDMRCEWIRGEGRERHRNAVENIEIEADSLMLIAGSTDPLTPRPRQNGRHFPDDIFKCMILNENVWIPNTIRLKFVPKGQIDNNTALVQVMAWRRTGDKPLSEPMMA